MADAKCSVACWWLKLLIIVLAFSASCVLAVVKVRQNEDRVNRFKAMDAEANSNYKLEAVSNQALTMACWAMIQEDQFREVFRGELIEATDVRTEPGVPSQPPVKHYYYVSPFNQDEVFDLTFTGGKLTSTGTHNWPPITPSKPRPEPVLETPEYLAGEHVRLVILKVSYIAWVVALVAALVAMLLRRDGRAISALLVFLAWLATLAWFLNPYYDTTLKGLSSNDRLAWGAAMIAVSLVVALVTAMWSRRAGRPDLEPAPPSGARPGGPA